MPTNEQRRKAAKRKLERQIERRAERAKRRRQRLALISVVAVVAVVAVAAGIYFLVSGPSEPEPVAAPACQYNPSEPAAKPNTPPDPNPPATGTVNVDLQTSQGAIPLTLDRASAPCAVNAVVSLASQGFYDDTPCPRLVTGQGLQVLQCGDPTGSGAGGPGYQYAEEPPQGLPPYPGAEGQASTYARGLVAMAKSSQPGSTGSQFFLVYGDSALPPEYSVIGRIATEGLAVLDRVGAGGDDGSNQAGGGAPNIPVQIQRAVVAAPPAP
ncbi:peptidylprolyl isomerase [Actinomycetospora lemnae]|uniref:Peptidylprolyl isomerase n=1 Tax=Actinomycetospora lemnae TaxID=3019891 RepID=A0ABT5SPN0_9PSEU|nr:peptidylprolyl isomerase [Actinomycetospora sp. DW7H6]MDD7964792.1 peptidylprolyl isomerase [Actinomycetospora sp. DW7H6]